LIREIREKIGRFRDPDTGDEVIHDTYFRDEIYTGPETEHSGDIQLTFRSGYRTSRQTSLGAVPANIVVANLKKCSGDHCASDPSDTAGFLVSNRRIVTVDPHLIDIAPTLYRVFGAPIPEPVDDRPPEWLP
jgi:predicted AlkP superfamily phosphohydrolase/phosphomutase